MSTKTIIKTVVPGDIVLWYDSDLDWGDIPVLVLETPAKDWFLGLALDMYSGVRRPRHRVKNYNTLGEFLEVHQDLKIENKFNFSLDMRVYDNRSWMNKYIVKTFSCKDVKLFTFNELYK